MIEAVKQVGRVTFVDMHGDLIMSMRYTKHHRLRPAELRFQGLSFHQARYTDAEGWVYKAIGSARNMDMPDDPSLEPWDD